MRKLNSLPLAVTCGDPSGVGPEIIADCLMSPLELGRAIAVIGPRNWLRTLKWDSSNVVELVEVGPFEYEVTAGEPGDDGAKIAIEAMEVAAEGCVSGRFSAVATGPISKENCIRVGYRFPGQTEFFADKWGGQPTMGFAGDRLNVVLATWHIPISEVPNAISESGVQLAVRRAAELAVLMGREIPKIAVCGLNPHAGEGGVLGTEERDLIDPTLNALRIEFPGLSRCLPGDTVFGRVLQGEFDVAVAMYHDQGLAPMKAVEFDLAVNVTLGLPFIRTSPDHGTAYGIAGKGVASKRSFSRAIKLAARFSDQKGRIAGE